MKKRLPLALALLSSLLLVTAPTTTQSQENPAAKPDAKSVGGAGKVDAPAASAAPATGKVVITTATPPLELARAAYLAQGGEKYRNLKSMVLSGSVDLYAPNSVNSLPGKFVIVISGERSRIEIQSPAFNFRQIYNGQQSYVSVRGMEMPQPNRFGIYVLMKYNQPGYVVTAQPDNKKYRAFRITDPEGNITDFSIDPQTGRVMSYLSPYHGFTFGVEHKTVKEMNGVLVPYSFTQRLETQQGAFFAEHKVKDVKLDVELEDDVFEIPEQQ